MLPSIKVAVQPCNMHASSESTQVLREYLMNYKLDYTRRNSIMRFITIFFFHTSGEIPIYILGMVSQIRTDRNEIISEL